MSPWVYRQAAAFLFYPCKSVLIWLCVGAHLWDLCKWIFFPLWAVDSQHSSGAAQPFLVGFKVKNPAVCTNYPDVWVMWGVGVLLAYARC